MASVSAAVFDELESEEREDSSLRLLARTSLPLPAAVDRVAEAVVAAWSVYDGVQLPRHQSFVAPTPAGPVLWVPDTWDLLDRLPGLVDALDQAGVRDARLELVDDEDPRVVDLTRPVDFLECRLAVRASQVGPEPDYAVAYWRLAEDVRAAQIALAADWCLALPAAGLTAYVNTGMVSARVPTDRVAELLRTAVETVFGHGPAGGLHVRLVVESGSAFRMAVLSFESAHISFVDGSTSRSDFDWARSLAALRTVITDAAPYTVRGMVKRGTDWAYVGDRTLRDDWVPIPRQSAWAPGLPDEPWGPEIQRAAEARYLLDAFGVVVVPGSDPVPAAPGWTATPIGPVTLVQHHDLDAWFAAERPDTAVLTGARDDLRDLLPPH